jgi:hypothetical protein
MTITRYKRTRFWAVYDASGSLICICVYKKGAEEVARRLGTPAPATDWCWQCKATLPAVADAASPCPHCGADLLLL